MINNILNSEDLKFGIDPTFNLYLIVKSKEIDDANFQESTIKLSQELTDRLSTCVVNVQADKFKYHEHIGLLISLNFEAEKMTSLDEHESDRIYSYILLTLTSLLKKLDAQLSIFCEFTEIDTNFFDDHFAKHTYAIYHDGLILPLEKLDYSDLDWLEVVSEQRRRFFPNIESWEEL